MLQNDPTIDHIFVTEHTPFFPNGGHVKDDMWYNGSNEPRAIVAGKPVKQGIIERRDQLLRLIVNETPKVVAILTGDEHNYCRTQIGPDTPIYPENYAHKKIRLKRTVWQINNGAAGAPYYAQEKTPWSNFTHGFTTQNALVLFYVQGKKVKMVVYNPDTLNLVDELQLR
jgi:phosphodiesterase/alkaline phosphatase D-like protein